LAFTSPHSLVPLAVTAWLLGARHAFDPDHIAAIDSATRTLAGGPHRQAAATTGFWFAVGHSLLVTGLAVATAAGAGALAPHLDGNPTFASITAAGPVVAGLLLIGLGVLNLTSGRGDSPAGVVGLVLPRLTRGLTHPRRMVGVGALFGLGFDTATEVSLLVMAATTSAQGVPWWATLCLPVLFAAGMTLFDTADSALLAHTYRWADGSALRRRQVTTTITYLSAGLAFFVGAQLLLESAGVGVVVDVSWVGFASVAALTVAAVAIWFHTRRRFSPVS